MRIRNLLPCSWFVMNSLIKAMKTKSIILTVLTTLTVSLPNGRAAINLIPLPPASPLVKPIVEISPSEATVGQVIIVRTESWRFGNPYLSKGGTPKIYFSGGAWGGPRTPGGNVTPLGNDRYSVVVPQGARSGHLRFENNAGNSYSTVMLTVVTAGYSVVNLSQFNIVSVKVDNVERLASPFTSGQPLITPIPATLPSEPNAFLADLDATAGNHSIQITLGPSPSQPVITYFLPSVSATIPLNNINVGIMLLGEYLVASPNATTKGNNVIASWQTLIINPDGPSINGLDFTHNTATGATSWAHWIGDRPNVVASGPVTEPANRSLNPTSVFLQLRRANGTPYRNIIIDLLTKTLFADDGFSYELQ